MKQLALLLVPIILVLSCSTAPPPVTPVPPVEKVQTAEPVQNIPPPEPPQALPPQPEPLSEEKVFDPGSVTQEKYETTKTDVQALIAELNRIIKARNYNAWRSHLSDSYFEEMSSPAFLEERTDELYKRDQIVASNLGRDPRKVQKKILRTPRDYFDSVVVPSRSNDRMDDIDFVSENRVVAYTVDSRGQRLILYDLELINDQWMINN